MTIQFRQFFLPVYIYLPGRRHGYAETGWRVVIPTHYSVLLFKYVSFYFTREFCEELWCAVGGWKRLRSTAVEHSTTRPGSPLAPGYRLLVNLLLVAKSVITVITHKGQNGPLNCQSERQRALCCVAVWAFCMALRTEYILYAFISKKTLYYSYLVYPRYKTSLVWKFVIK